MKIGHLENKPAVTKATTERKGAGENAAAAADAPSTTEASAQVELSPAASMIPKDGDTAEFDSAKVDRIATAIREGKFTVNHEAIADKLIANAQELLGRAAH